MHLRGRFYRLLIEAVSTRREEPPMAESQLAELQNMRVLLEEVRLLARNLTYHQRARIEARLDLVLYEIDQEIEDLRANRG
jgi:hypothetical protein